MSLKLISNIEIPSPLENNNPTTKQYVDGKFIPGKQKLIACVTTSSNIVLPNIEHNDGWLVIVDETTTPGIIKFPQVNISDSTEIVTYEIMLRCMGEETETLSFSFSDSEDNEIKFLGNTMSNVPRGYTYFIAFRNFSYKSENENSITNSFRQWVGNIQGMVKIPV